MAMHPRLPSDKSARLFVYALAAAVFGTFSKIVVSRWVAKRSCTANSARHVLYLRGYFEENADDVSDGVFRSTRSGTANLFQFSLASLEFPAKELAGN